MSFSYVANIYEVSQFKMSNGLSELRVYGRKTLKKVGEDKYIVVDEIKLFGFTLFLRPVNANEVITITHDDFSRLNGKINQLYFYNLNQTKIYNTNIFDVFRKEVFHVDLLYEEDKDLKILNRGVSNKVLQSIDEMPHSRSNLIHTEMSRRLERIKIPERGLDRFTPYVIAGICLFGGIGFVILFKVGLDEVIANLDNAKDMVGMVIR